VSIFLDLSKEFDCVNHNIPLKKLNDCEIRGVSLEFFTSYLKNRKQFTVIDETKSNLLEVLCGVPQGSVLGPPIDLLCINHLCNASNFNMNPLLSS